MPAAAGERRRAGVGADEPEEHAQRRALAGAVRPEEPGHPARGDRERQVVDGADPTEGLAEPGDLDGGTHVAERTERLPIAHPAGG